MNNSISLEEVFRVMVKHDFKVKAASQELQIKKSRIYNIKHRNKDKWHELMQKHGKEQAELEGQSRTTGVKKWANHKIDRNQRGVKSNMEDKYVGKTFSITDDKKTEKPVNVQRSVTGESYKEENARLVKQNKELGEALERTNAKSHDITAKYNRLVDDHNDMTDNANERISKLKREVDTLEKEKQQLKQALDECQSAMKPTEELPNVELHEDYLVKLGKVFVTPAHELTRDYREGAMMRDDVIEVAKYTGGQIYQSALVPYRESDSVESNIL